jgi:TrmH family RNA methyltransferase
VSEDPRITSRHHPLIQRCRRVAQRGDDDVVLLDGEHLVDEARRARVPIDAAITDGRAESVVGRLRAAGVPVHDVSPALLEAASPVRTPSGVVALARWRPAPLADALDGPRPLALALCDVQDPGNLGSVIRAADALGATGVLTLGESAQPGGWKALRGAMGSTFRVPVARGALGDAIRLARARGLHVFAAVATGGTPIERANLTRPALILVGHEGAGLAETTQSAADERITVPMRAGVDSLNVAVTAALLLFEARRQRASPTP